MGEKVNYECKFKDTSGYWIANNRAIKKSSWFLEQQSACLECRLL